MSLMVSNWHFISQHKKSLNQKMHLIFPLSKARSLFKCICAAPNESVNKLLSDLSQF